MPAAESGGSTVQAVMSSQTLPHHHKKNCSPFGLHSTKAMPETVTIGGGSRIRTGDILLAKQTLYQLSYTPEAGPPTRLRRPASPSVADPTGAEPRRMVGVDGIEPSTSSLSGTRSNQLSYTPRKCLRKRHGTETSARGIHLRPSFAARAAYGGLSP